MYNFMIFQDPWNTTIHPSPSQGTSFSNFLANALLLESIVPHMLVLQPQLSINLPKNYEVSFATWLLAELLVETKVP